MTIYVYIYIVCMHACTHVRRYKCRYVGIGIGMQVCTYIRRYVCMYVFMYVGMYVCRYACVF